MSIDIKALTKDAGKAPAPISFGKPAVLPSGELKRILEIPRRPKPDDIKSQALIELMTGRLGFASDACACSDIDPKRPCIRELRVTQAWALYEIGLREGLLGPINVGDGKTILDLLAPLVMPRCRTALLLVPAKLVDQAVLEYRLVREHFRVPGLVVHGRDVSIRVPDAPVLHMISYERLSQKDATTFLESLAPDMIIADECDALKDRTSVRTKRVLRYWVDHRPRFCGWSGSLTDASIKDYAHLAAMCLRSYSPLPIDPEVAADWARAIDPSDFPAPPGALTALCEPGETLYSGFQRRLTQTEGVVTSTKPQVDAELVIRERKAPKIPAEIRSALRDLRDSWMRPDGEELIDALAFFRCARELACGFYYRWIFTKGETVAEIEEWLAARKAWRREVRRMLQDPKPHLDSPALLAMAAIRAARYPAAHSRKLWHAKTENSDEPLPHWRSDTYARWIKAKPLVNGGKNPDTEPVRIHPYLAEDAAAWGRENRGVIWYAATAFGEWVSEISGLPLHGGGPGAGERIGRERGDRSIVASIKSHGRGRNGLQFLFASQLVAHPPASATDWEQTLGRLHRSGQKSPIVTADFYRHTPELRAQVDKALMRADYVAGTIGYEQKLRQGWAGAE